MINKDKWINSLPKDKIEPNQEGYQLDSGRWENTIPKKRTFNSVKKYSLMLVLFVSGLLFVAVVKNETRNLQKEINNLKASISLLNSDLKQTTLDYEVITSPENLLEMAKKHLEFELRSYKKSQIRNLKNEEQKNPWLKIKTEAGNRTKITNNIDGSPIKGFYMYINI